VFIVKMSRPAARKAAPKGEYIETVCLPPHKQLTSTTIPRTLCSSPSPPPSLRRFLMIA